MIWYIDDALRKAGIIRCCSLTILFSFKLPCFLIYEGDAQKMTFSLATGIATYRESFKAPTRNAKSVLCSRRSSYWLEILKSKRTPGYFSKKSVSTANNGVFIRIWGTDIDIQPSTLELSCVSHSSAPSTAPSMSLTLSYNPIPDSETTILWVVRSTRLTPSSSSNLLRCLLTDDGDMISDSAAAARLPLSTTAANTRYRVNLDMSVIP